MRRCIVVLVLALLLAIPMTSLAFPDWFFPLQEMTPGGSIWFFPELLPGTNVDPIVRLSKSLRSVAPVVDSLRVYRVKALSDTCVWGKTVIHTVYKVRLEATYGSGGSYVPGDTIRVRTCGGTIGDLRCDCFSNHVHLEQGRSVVVGLTNARDTRDVLIAKDQRLVGYPDDDSIRFDDLGVSIDSAGLCRIVESLRARSNQPTNRD